MPKSTAANRDFALVEQCLAGDKGAWRQLYLEQHPNLLAQVSRMLFDAGRRCDVADEVAARVWCRLLDHDFRALAQFDLRRDCRLSTYLAGMATKEVLRYLRAERRLHVRNHRRIPVRNKHYASLDAELAASISDFLTTLTPREREFCQQHLLAAADPNLSTPLSSANVWQLRHRVKRKLSAFLRAD